MSEAEPIVKIGARETSSLSRHKAHHSSACQDASTSVPLIPRSFSNSKSEPAITAFDRKELNQILTVYGRQVAEGEWRDYAIYHGRESAVFSIFRRTSEMPLYRVQKQPRLARKQGKYAIVSATGMILRRGHDLSQVLKIIDRRPKLVTV